MADVRAPKGLGVAGRSTWRAVAGKYDLRPDELATLEQACFTADMIESLNAHWLELGCPMITKGSLGQEVIHPMVGEIRAQRSQLAALLARLKLPDDGAAAEDMSSSARKAAASRWSKGA